VESRVRISMKLLVCFLVAAIFVANIADARRVTRQRVAFKKFGPLRPVNRVAECISRGGECHTEEEGCIVDGRIEWTSAGASLPNEWRMNGLCEQTGTRAEENLKCCVNQYQSEDAAAQGFHDLLRESHLKEEDIFVHWGEGECENCVRMMGVTKLTMTALMHLRVISKCPLAVVGGTEREGLADGFGLEMAADMCLSQWILTHTAQDPYHLTKRFDESGTTYELVENTRWRVVFARLAGPPKDQVGEHGPHIDLQRPVKEEYDWSELV
jgi:hypothetical protein